MSLSILIVLYNCKAEDSETIKSILNTNSVLLKTKLCVWNNGPIKGMPKYETISRLEEKGVSTTYIETLQNAPLSWIYNTFIEKFQSKKYVIFDHDSTLSEDYISYVSSDNIDYLGVPLINAKGFPRSPTANGKFSQGPYKKSDRVIAIGSGIIISQEAVDKIKSAYGSVFDECFALYGVDTSFFTRVFRLGMSDRIKLIPGFEHSLSRLENEPEKIQRFRSIERSYDLGLMIRHYPEISNLKIIIKLLILTILRKKPLFIREILSAFATGHHERCDTASQKQFKCVLARQTIHE